MTKNNLMTVKSEAEKPKLDAHVIAKINEDFYRTSKVEIPKDVKSKKLQKCFEQLKRDFTYESQKNVVKVQYTDLNQIYDYERRQIITVEITESNRDPQQHKSIYFSDTQFKNIQKTLPNGYVFRHVSTAIFYHKKEDYVFSHQKHDEQALHLEIQFEKITKKVFEKGDDRY